MSEALLAAFEAELTEQLAPIQAKLEEIQTTLASPLYPEITTFEPNASELTRALRLLEHHSYTCHAVITLAHVLRSEWGDTEAAGILESVLPALAAHEAEVA